VVLVMMMGQSRIAYTISRDGLLPKAFGRVHPRFRTPYVSTVVVGVLASALAGLIPLNVLGELVSMGTLLAFATVCIGVLVLRYTKPDITRPFKVPVPWLICPLGAIACVALFLQAFVVHWHLFVGWTVLGLLIYFGYGMRHSKLNDNA
jgi:APA family basic amino acid/polyamine antiporter